MDRIQLEQDIVQLQQAKQQALEQLTNWQARVLKTEGALEFTQLQLKRLEPALVNEPEQKD